MKEFKGLVEFIAHLAASQAAVPLALHYGLDMAAKRIEKTAKDEIGHYQAEVGGFPEWPELADATEAEKMRLGYPLEAPLLRTGEMQERISREVDGLEAAVGSPDDKMVYHEFGTDKIPARPVLGPAAFRNTRQIQEYLGAAAVAGFLGDSRIHPALGYELGISDPLK